MKNPWQMIVSILTVLILATAIGASPPRTTSGSTPHQNAAKDQAETQFQSASGKIASVQKNSFTLETNESTPPGQHFRQGRSHPNTMIFLIDENTAVDGKLSVSANADVTYRQKDGNNVAVSVQVTN